MSRWPEVGRWLLAPLVDDWRGLSMTRLLAVGGFVLAAESIVRERPVPTGALWLYLAAVSAAFGKATFTVLLERLRLSAEVRDVTTHAITERRASADYPGTDPAP